MNSLEPLFHSLQTRPRPEDVAEMVLDALDGNLSTDERALLERAAAGSLKRGMHQFSSMLQYFQRPKAPIRQTSKARELFIEVPTLTPEQSSDPEQVVLLIRQLSGEIRKQVGNNDFRENRLNRSQREDAGLDISKRRYNKLFRFLQRFERKLDTYRYEQRKYAATRIAKAGLATLISWEDFSASPDAACLIAYFSAAKNRRSVFSNKGQTSAFDEIAAMLLQRFRKAPCQRGWRAIVQILPDAEIVAELSDADRLALFANYLTQLEEIATLLHLTWQRSNFNRETMIVKRGDDSTTWNVLAGAWNAARQGWLALALSLGLDDLVDAMCLGKVMRLMAADVVAWHRLSGGALHPDTLIWAELPAPWEVLAGNASCTRAEVEAVCAKYAVDPVARAWTAARDQRKAIQFSATPELVHGVAVGHPSLAAAMKKAGWFSGKPAK